VTGQQPVAGTALPPLPHDLPAGYTRAEPWLPVPPPPDWWHRLYGPTGTSDPINPQETR
jgi:hypothetical protein